MSDMPSVYEFSENIADAEAPAPLPPGDYIGVIKEVEAKDSSKGNRYASVSFHISPDQYPVDFTDGPPDGITLAYNRVVLKDDARSRFAIRRFCEAIDAPMGKAIDLLSWIGQEAKLTVKHSEYEGVKRAEIDRVTKS